jgi:hypothetical protein
MPFQFRNYGTFTGPAGTYDYLDEEPTWPEDLPEDVSFKLTDLAVVLFNNQANYVGFYCNGTNTQLMTLAHSTGNIPTLRIQADNTIVNGKALINGNTIVNGTVLVNGSLTVTGSISGPTITQLQAQIASKKSFDIPHPTKKDHRLRYICLEGPAAEVYFRGKLQNQSVIEIPEYWSELVDMETLGVQLTPIGAYQELFVDKVEWGKRIVIRNNAGSNINCYYTVTAERKDVERNIPEYPGNSPKDYPGNNSEYAINGGTKLDI